MKKKNATNQQFLYSDNVTVKTFHYETHFPLDSDGQKC